MIGTDIRRKILLVCSILFFAVSCSEKELDPNDAKKSFGIAKEPYDDGNYEKAVQRLGEFKSRFPYSQYTAEAELLIADAYFKSDKFSEAAVSYEQFVKLHPKHPQVDFAMYRVGESHWKLAPEEIDRDQEDTLKAIDEWKKLVEKLPDSEYGKKAKKNIEEGRRRVAESEQFISHFYCKQEIYHACAYRYMDLLEDYPEFKDIANDALKELVMALKEVAKAKEKDPESDKNIFFKTMTAQQIREKAETFEKLIR